MANPKLGAKGVPGVACYPLVTHKKISNKFWGSHNWCPWTHILDSHIGQSYWTVIMTVLFFIVPVQCDCLVCEMCLNKPSSSHKNVRPLFIVKIWILGYNDKNRILRLFCPVKIEYCDCLRYTKRILRPFCPGPKRPKVVTISVFYCIYLKQSKITHLTLFSSSRLTR